MGQVPLAEQHFCFRHSFPIPEAKLPQDAILPSQSAVPDPFLHPPHSGCTGEASDTTKQEEEGKEKHPHHQHPGDKLPALTQARYTDLQFANRQTRRTTLHTPVLLTQASGSHPQAWTCWLGVSVSWREQELFQGRKSNLCLLPSAPIASPLPTPTSHPTRGQAKGLRGSAHACVPAHDGLLPHSHAKQPL